MSWGKQYYDVDESKFWDGLVKESTKKAGAGLYIVVVKGDNNKKLKMIIKK